MTERRPFTVHYTSLTIEWIKFLDKFNKIRVSDISVCNGLIHLLTFGLMTRIDICFFNTCYVATVAKSAHTCHDFNLILLS